SVEDELPIRIKVGGPQKPKLVDEARANKYLAAKLNFAGRIAFPIFNVIFLIAYSTLAYQMGYNKMLLSDYF
ncbi:hypothetical protein SK128_010653, partial [Halocaridina rubra]